MLQELTQLGLPPDRSLYRSVLVSADTKVFFGKPCRQGHIQGRYISNGRCIVCCAINWDKLRANHPGRLAASGAKSSKTYFDRHRGDPRFWARCRLNALRGKSKREGILFDLKLQDIMDAIPKNLRCPVFDTPLVFTGKGRCFYRNSASIDRLRPHLGYVPGNVRVVSNWANLIKRDVVRPEDLRKVASWMEAELDL